MSEIDMSQNEIPEIFGGEAQPIKVDAQELEVSLALQSIRVQLLEVAEKAKVGTVQLAGRLGIAPSAVSRFLGGEGDMKVSTAVLYARALGHRWELFLKPDVVCVGYGNYHGQIKSPGITGSVTKTSGVVQIRPAVTSVPGYSRSQLLDVRAYA